MIGISVQGSSAQAFYDIAGVKIDYEQYRENVLDLFRRSRGKVQVSTKIADYGQSEAEKQKFIDDFSDRCDFIAIEGLHGWASSEMYDWKLGTNNSFDGTPRANKIACPLVLYMLTVNSNGDVSICNDDFAHYHQIGNANETNLFDIWKSKKLLDFRLMHLEGRRGENAACAHCDYLLALPDQIDDDLDTIKERLLNEELSSMRKR
jgi:radical SAM protein with 4Fe4S-binding SPASM domain